MSGEGVGASCLLLAALKCNFPGFDEPTYFTQYTDGTPARIGTGIGVGDKALTFQDRFGAIVFIETNMDGTPISLTTIEPTLRAIHSSHSITFDGRVPAPSQVSGRCEPVVIR